MEYDSSRRKDLLSGQSLKMDETAGAEWKKAGSWARAIGIVCIVGMAVIVLALIIMLLFSGTSGAGADGVLLMAIVLVVVIAIVVGGIWVVNLMRFGTNAIASVRNADQHAFEKSVTGLKYFFIISAISSILAILYTIITLIAG